MKRFICLAALAAAAVLAEDPAPAPVAPAKVPQVLLPLEQWLAGGAWICTGEEPAGPEVQIKTRLEMKLDRAGFWLRIKGTLLSGPMKGKQVFAGFAAFDGTRHQRYTFQPGGMSHLTSKGWEGNKMVFEGEGMTGGQQRPLRQIITRTGDNQFGSVWETDGKATNQQICTRAAVARK